MRLWNILIHSIFRVYNSLRYIPGESKQRTPSEQFTFIIPASHLDIPPSILPTGSRIVKQKILFPLFLPSHAPIVSREDLHLIPPHTYLTLTLTPPSISQLPWPSPSRETSSHLTQIRTVHTWPPSRTLPHIFSQCSSMIPSRVKMFRKVER